MAQNPNFQLQHPSTHKIPDFLPACRPAAVTMLMTFKWVPIAAARPKGRHPTPAESHDRYFGFCPAKSQLYSYVVKCRKALGGRHWGRRMLGGPFAERLSARTGYPLGRPLGRRATTG